MTHNKDNLDLAWLDGDMPYALAFGDRFYCQGDGRAECGHVFLAGNGLPQRWQNSNTFTIGELGFGTGLNFSETWRQWKEHRKSAAHLHFISFERYPMAVNHINRALSRWPELAAERVALCARWPDNCQGTIDIVFDETIRLSVMCGDAFQSLGASTLMFDAWYLDGFAPSRNPDMWSSDLMKAVFDYTRQGGSLATYTAAGFVRRNMAAAGFIVEKRRGFGAKREMLTAAKQ